MDRALIRSSVPLFLGSILASLVPAAAQAATGPSVWVQSASDHVFSSTVRPDRAVGNISLFAARNEVQAAQISVRSDDALSDVHVAAGDLTGPGGAVIPASRITVNREYNHPRIEKQTQGSYQDPPDGGTSYYDALVENTPHPVAAATTQPYYYSVAVPTGQTPGTYTGTATVQSSAGPVAVPVSLTVYQATLPPTDRSTFRMDNWFTSAGWDYGWTEAAIPTQYQDAAMYSPNWWKVIASIAADHAKHRNNVIHADFQALAIPDTTLADGRYTFRWGTFDRFVQTFVDAGALQYIYTPHLLEGGPLLEALVSDGNGGVTRGFLTPGSPEATAYLDKVLPALKAHLDSKCLDPGPSCAPGRRWSDVFYMSASDEPRWNDQATASNWLYGRYHAYFPQGLTNEAHDVRFDATDQALGTLTPKGDADYDANAGHYQAQRLAGKDLWLYYCNGPVDGHVNRFISYPLADSRLTPWMVSSVGGDGFLHWGWNIWAAGGPGNWTPADTFDGWTSGDPYLVRPDKADYGIYDSTRSEALLFGLQDYELLHQLAATKPVLARALTGTLITNTTTFTTSGAELDQRHRQLLDALASPAGDAAYPYSDDFSAGNDANWRHTRGSWSVTGDQAYVQSSTATDSWQDWEVVSGLAGRAYGDVTADVDVRITGVNAADGGDTDWAGLTVHSLNPTDTQTGYLVALRNNGEVFVNRSGSTLATGRVPGYTAGRTVTLRVATKGSRLQVFAGPVPVITLDDPSYPVGAIGLATGGASARFDNVRINPLTDPVEGAKVTASSSYESDGWGAQALTDGRRGLPDGSAGWSSIDNYTVDHPEWVSVDLGATSRLSRVDLYPRSDGANAGMGFPIDFTVQVSADNVHWTTVADRKGYPKPDGSVQSFPFAATDVRYIKVSGTKLATDPHGNYHLQLAELEGYGDAVAAGRPVTVSSSVENTAAGWVRAAATDGVQNSALGYSMGWSSAETTATGHEWATVDLQGATLLSQVRLTGRTDGSNTGLGFPVDFTVQVSDDNAHWTTVAARTGFPRPGTAAQVFTFAPVTARYVKVDGTRLSADQFGAYHLQLGEIGVG